jgi:hypothetical protein
MEKTYYVASVVGDFMPTIFERFSNRTDAETYAALMCRVKSRKYIVLEKVGAEWDGTPDRENN